LTWL
jgi:hypothetical protein